MEKSGRRSHGARGRIQNGARDIVRRDYEAMSRKRTTITSVLLPVVVLLGARIVRPLDKLDPLAYIIGVRMTEERVVAVQWPWSGTELRTLTMCIIIGII